MRLTLVWSRVLCPMSVGLCYISIESLLFTDQRLLGPGDLRSWTLNTGGEELCCVRGEIEFSTQTTLCIFARVTQ